MEEDQNGNWNWPTAVGILVVCLTMVAVCFICVWGTLQLRGL